MVEPLRAEQDDSRLRLVEQPREPGSLDDVAMHVWPRRDHALGSPYVGADACPWCAAVPAALIVHGVTSSEKGDPAPGARAPGAGCRQPPAPAVAGAGSRERGSSPVSVLNAAGI